MGLNSDDVLLLSPERIKRTLRRICYQIVEDHAASPDIIFLGVDERGFALAGLLSEEIGEILGTQVPHYRLAVKSENTEARLPDDISGKKIIIVDDVLFSGKTLMKAIIKVSGSFDLQHLQVAVLVDRGHRSFPVTAQYVGVVRPTKLNEHVSVQFDAGQNPAGVLLKKAF